MINTPFNCQESIKTMFFALLLMAFVSCSGNSDKLEATIDSLKKQVAAAYKPGLGEFMSDIQVHHAKLYFAGKDQNWELADFEMGEIKEAVDNIKKYCTDRPEVKSLPILYPSLDSLNKAIKLKSLRHFETSFMFLTQTCNSCHQSTHHAFNVIRAPLAPPFSNQEFKVK
ncbi:MAG: hypothetical protein ACXVJD_17555 [Mucilaginibacter sp.]